MNGTQRELRWEILRLLCAQHPGTLTFQQLFDALRVNDDTLTKVELLTALTALTRHNLTQRIAGDLLKPERYRVTSEGKTTFESSSD